MIDTAVWFLRCDRCRTVYGKNDNCFELRRAAERAGWVFYVKLDGTLAKRGGKDYCPACRPVPAEGADHD